MDMEYWYWIIVAIAGIATPIALLKLYIKLTTGRCTNQTRLVGKTVIITGANTGLGFETALDLAKRGARVILACRSAEKANEAKHAIVNATSNPDVVVQLVNFASLTSVRKFAEDINNNEERLDVLVNNAGMGGADDELTEDGLQYGTQINHFAPFLLTNLLINILKRSAPSRVVNVTSIVAKYGKINLDKLNKFNGSTANYYESKLCNLLFTIELNERLRGTGVTTYAVHPGVVMTDLYRNMPTFLRIPTELFIGSFFKNPKEGAQTQIYLATEEGIEKYSGGYFEDCKRKSLFRSATKDPSLPKLLWEKTIELVKLTSEENQLGNELY